jgi:thiol-disulfide isomerase/thioredoxin
MAVVDIDSEAAFDKTIKSAGSALVIVDYSTTWCGPCKVIAPKFDQLSDKYPEAVFLKVRRSMRGNTRDLPSSRETDQCWWKYFLGDC